MYIEYNYQQGTIKEYDVRPLPGDNESEAVAYDGNDIVVNSWGGGKSRSYLDWWSNIQRGVSAPTIIPNLAGGNNMKASKIFARSAVGYAEVKPGESHAFIFEMKPGAPGGASVRGFRKPGDRFGFLSWRSPRSRLGIRARRGR